MRNNKIVLLILIILLAFLMPLFLFPKPKIILLSFDTELIDSNQDVYKLLTLLDKYKAKSTFFVMGKLAEENPQLIKDIKNHTHSVECSVCWGTGKVEWDGTFRLALWIIFGLIIWGLLWMLH